MRWQPASATLFCLSQWQPSVQAAAGQREGDPRVVRLPLQRRDIPDPAAHDRQRIMRREGTIQAELNNLKTLYFFNATLGTPPQNLRLHLDTGSSDLWVNTASSALCQSSNQPCQLSGAYTANSSSTYEYLNSQFNISYVDGSSAHGDYVTDTFRFGDIGIDNFQFGIGYTSSSPQGILGIGYPTNEVQAARFGHQPYSNLPSRLLTDKHVATNAYSIWLDDINSTTGSLLFGGVDRSQYRGSLVTLPVQKSGSIFREFFITMTGLDAGSKPIIDNMALAVLLDTGSSLTYLPNDLATSVFQALNVTWFEKSQLAIIPCDRALSDESVTFRFSEPASISVLLSELVLPIITPSGSQPTLQDGTAACLFGIFPSGNGAVVLGDTFLRSAYVVYDMANNQVSLAQSNFDAKPSGSEVVEIGSGKNQIPDATMARNPVAAKSGLPVTGNMASFVTLERQYLGITMFAIFILGAFGGF
ncbi:candidapepsin-4 precursor [Cordyceps fumosorosea ARSEF 2679]|uniref:Probable aspartic-type endopeptidase OPSB n=1 Tax=Cordyceps fumosorosea (strain ARSEF 2679) TaxID=1081104 RepID=A0A167RS83_CORFA|nr:candidapepsin-4 precursor [Cordyceps fumosorosea ARSEF 2679]OAA58886.1 candidapepsin-4 precursor [Cordyceps fumosorosea ARSEF 2679]